MCAPTTVIMHASILSSSSAVMMGTMLNQVLGFSIISALLGFKIVRGLTVLRFRNLGLSRVTTPIRKFFGAIHATKQ